MTLPLTIRKGDRYGRLTIVREICLPVESRVFVCRCDCGKKVRVRLHNLRVKNKHRTRSCGCLRKEVSTRLGKATRKHGYSYHKAYKLYFKMMDRCYKPSHVGYKNYGGRGIGVCKLWRNNQMAFVVWAINNGWRNGLQIDRRNNNGNYTPANCRFVTVQVQAQNRRKPNRKTR